MLTVGQLKKKLKGVKDSTPVYLQDHDHGTYETNGMASKAYLLNQDQADPWDVPDPEFKITGDYFVIGV